MDFIDSTAIITEKMFTLPHKYYNQNLEYIYFKKKFIQRNKMIILNIIRVQKLNEKIAKP